MPPFDLEAYKVGPGETSEQYNARIAALRGDAPESLARMQNLTTTALSSPVPALNLAPVTAPTLPAPGSPEALASYVGGVQGDVASARTQVEAEYKRNREDIQTRRSQLEAQQREQQKMQDQAIAGAKPLLDPFRAGIEKSERERLKVEENFFSNQNLVAEMESIAGGLQADIDAVKDLPAPAAIQKGKIGKVKEDAIARLGMLQAVLAARNSQIGYAETLIDRSVAAITADRKDQLAYYQTILDFYGKREGDTKERLLTLDKEDKAFAEKEIALLENDSKSIQERANRIKEMMTDPKTAQALAQAGVKLTDTEAEINTKLGNYAYQQEVKDQVNKMEADGYEYLPVPALYANKPESELVRLKDSKGTERVYRKSPTSESTPALALYESTIRQAMGEGATPQEAVFAAVAIADATGTKLNLETQGQLLNLANNITKEKPEESGETPPEDALAKSFGQGTFKTVPIRERISSLQARGIFTSQDIRAMLKESGYQKQAINEAMEGVESSFDSFMHGLTNSLFGE